jgi:hypothetical protein
MGTRKYSRLIASLSRLRADLDAKNLTQYSTTFAEVEQWAGAPLPPAAYKHRPWWSNNSNNSNADRPWEQAYFRTERVNMAARTVVFRKLPLPPKPTSPSFARFSPPTAMENGMADAARPYIPQQQARAPLAKTDRHPLRGALKGTIRLAVDVDLSAPADPDWGANT